MKYKLVARVNPQDRSKQKLYAAPVMDGKITQNDLKKEIVQLSSLSKGDVSNVIESFIDVIPKYLLIGKSVSLGELGTLRLSFTSEGVANEGEFTVSKIKGVRVLFTPSPALRKSIEDVSFEKVSE
ncbi:MAG: HU family DNA-binding protein [Bacteroidales bacterium]|jgi:predicted histone-like DNA-binding protein|nr:HU family DNA-binding protein [Bacteroidales bacterium]